MNLDRLPTWYLAWRVYAERQLARYLLVILLYTYSKECYCHAFMLEKSEVISFHFSQRRSAHFYINNGAPSFWEKDVVRWIRNFSQPDRSAERCAHYVSNKSICSYYSLTHSAKYFTAMLLCWNYLSSYGSNNFSKNRASIICTKKEHPLFQKKMGPYEPANFDNLIFQLSSVRTTSVMTARACTTVWHVTKIILLLRNYVCKFFKFIWFHQFSRKLSAIFSYEN